MALFNFLRRYASPSIKAAVNLLATLKTVKGWCGMRFFGDMSDQSFWNRFYARRQGNKRFDWFVRFEDVIGHLDPYLPPVGSDDLIRILDIGCGTSDFSFKVFEHLNRKCRIDCIDFSSEAVKAMGKIMYERGLLAKEAFDAERSVHPQNFIGLACHQADAKNLPFSEETFTLALDKGTSDAVLKGANGESAFVDVVKESLRVLKQDGKLVQFSDEPPAKSSTFSYSL